MKFTLIATSALILIISGVFLWNLSNRKVESGKKEALSPTSQSQTTQPEEVNIKATFQIVTGNITRNFSNPKYHLQSPDVFIQKEDPTIVHVKKSAVTWSDFFATLPMKLTKDCLITGDGEILCSDNNRTLKFYLNEKEEPDLLDKEIKNKDKALITIKSD